MTPPILLPQALDDGVVRLDGHDLQDALAHWQGEDEEMRRRFDSPDPSQRPGLEHTYEVMRRWIAARAAGGPGFVFAMRADGGDLAGGCELQRPKVELASISWWLYPGFRGRGLATRAARLLCEAAFASMPDLERIEARVAADIAPLWR